MLESAADAISRCNPFHMLYISVSQNTVADENEEVKELMEVVHISINLVISDAKADMMSWNTKVKVLSSSYQRLMQRSGRMRSPPRSIQFKLLSASHQGSLTQNLTCQPWQAVGSRRA